MSQPSEQRFQDLEGELEQARGQIAALTARLDGIVNAAVDGLVIIETNGLIEVFNPSAERIFGYQAAEVLGRDISMLMPEPYRQQHSQYVENYLRTGEARIIGIGREVSGLRRDGTEFPMYLAVGELVTHDGGRRFVGIIRDISSLKETESSLRQREEQLRLLFDNTPVGILMTESDGRIVAVNAALCRLLGYGEPDLLSMRLRMLVQPEEVARCDDQLSGLANGMPHAAIQEFRLQRADGSPVYAALHCGLVNIPDREPLVVVQVVDRTDQVRAETEAREHRERLAHVGRVTTMGEMASGIAHEINQPLTAIATYAQATRRLLERGDGDEGELREALDQISRQAERAGAIIRRLRSFVRRRESDIEEIDVNDQLRLVVRLAEVDLREHQSRIEVSLEEDLPPVMGDAIQIQQVTLNLIRNAIEAMAEVPADQKIVSVTSLRGGSDAVEVQIRDRGHGISEEQAASLFTPFQTTKKSGMGLGLTISSSIIIAHGGKLWYTPDPGGGACFHFTLPVALGTVDE